MWEKHLVKTYYLSCCEVRYGFGMEIHPFLFKVLGEFSFAKIKKIHSLTYSSMVIEIPTKTKISWYILKSFYFCCLLLHWVLSNFVVCTLRDLYIMLLKLKSHTLHPYMLNFYTGGRRKKCHLFWSTQKYFILTLGLNKKTCFVGFSSK